LLVAANSFGEKMSERNDSSFLASIRGIFSFGEETHVDNNNEIDDIVNDVITTIESETPDVPAIINKRAKRAVTVLSGKGGVGKTTTLLGLAGAAEESGLKVLLIDLDPQGSLTLAALDRHNVPTALEAFKGKALAHLATPAVWKEYRGSVDIVPASRALAEVEGFVDPKAAVANLTKALGDLSSYDLVLIDAPATLNKLTFEAISLANSVVVVAEPTLFSLRSASDAIQFALAVRRARAGFVRKVFIALNKVDASEESQYRVREIKRMFPNLVLKSAIESAAVINEASGSGLPVHAMPGVKARRAADQFNALLEEITA
jgi:cellulose biosynthesis protein BcsQ